MFKKLSAAIISVALLSATSISAADNQPNMHKGFYLSGDMGWMFDNYLICSNQLLGPFNQSDHCSIGSDFGLGAALGYMFMPYLGIEAITIIPFGTIITGDSWFGGNLKLNIPIGNNFAVFLKGGAGAFYQVGGTWYDESGAVIYVEPNTSTAGGLLGGGFSYSFNQHSELSVECNSIIFPSPIYNDSATIFYGMLGFTYTYHF